MEKEGNTPLDHCRLGADWDPIIAPVCYEGVRCTCECEGCKAAKARGDEIVPVKTEKRKIKWQRRWAPLCPFDDRELNVRANSAGFFLYCGCCERYWPLTKEDEARIKDESEIQA